MKSINGKYVESQMINGKMVQEMWLNGQLIWQGIRSCFGGGLWLNDKPWLNDDAWKNE